MPGEMGLPIALWAIGLAFVIASILVTIARLARYRYSGTFETPWIRGGGYFLVGAGFLSGAMYLLGAEQEVVRAWQIIAPVVVVSLVVGIYRYQR